MKKLETAATQALFEKNVISEEQFNKIKSYRSLSIFSLHYELRFLLYLAITALTSGIAVITYQNIDSFGHIALLSALFLTIATCFYFCFKNAPSFKFQETKFENALFDYLLLSANILSCTFIGYLQYQYKFLGTYYSLATLIPTIISFGSAYYFDNKNCLSIAITGLAACIGLSVSPQSLLKNGDFSTANLNYFGLLLGIAFVLWVFYSDTINLKKHFKLVFLSFSIHLIGIACSTNLFLWSGSGFDFYLIFFTLIAIASFWYFFKTSTQIQSISIFIFTLLYSYISFNLVLFKITEATINLYSDMLIVLACIINVYFIVSIICFIKLITNFKKEMAHDSV